jgi:hypothetical protein
MNEDFVRFQNSWWIGKTICQMREDIWNLNEKFEERMRKKERIGKWIFEKYGQAVDWIRVSRTTTGNTNHCTTDPIKSSNFQFLRSSQCWERIFLSSILSILDYIVHISASINIFWSWFGMSEMWGWEQVIQWANSIWWQSHTVRLSNLRANFVSLHPSKLRDSNNNKFNFNFITESLCWDVNLQIAKNLIIESEKSTGSIIRRGSGINKQWYVYAWGNFKATQVSR